ncbi:MAG TPA: DUF397 domain-containing protein [Thermomonospora sp.]|nr:DUF397 domain-containing protein [Thermomonospora sp.]
MHTAWSSDVTAPVWRRACHANNTCVEVARLGAAHLGTRDGKLGDQGPVLRFTAGQWRAFADRVRSGDFDVA